jgi:hypothetical protein
VCEGILMSDLELRQSEEKNNPTNCIFRSFNLEKYSFKNISSPSGKEGKLVSPADTSSTASIHTRDVVAELTT